MLNWKCAVLWNVTTCSLVEVIVVLEERVAFHLGVEVAQARSKEQGQSVTASKCILKDENKK
jgi:uncharacterized membrane protein